MLKDIKWPELRNYESGSEFEPVQFYLESLYNSKRFDLLLGYFSSAAINVLSLGFATFLYNGGVVRIIANNILSIEDKGAIDKGINNNVNPLLFDISDIKSLKDNLDDYGVHFFECLAWLISKNKIQFKIIKPKDGRGISHYKSGIFSDGNSIVSFKASCNFTAYGLLENLEQLQSFLSWDDERSQKIISKQVGDFEKIFSEKSDVVEYLKINEVIEAIKSEFGNSNIDELLIKEKELIKKKTKVLENKKYKKSLIKIAEKIDLILNVPKFPYKEGAREYQIEAYQNWVDNNYQGIFSMATGTGKTITSLNCILREYENQKYYKAVILVPTIALVSQWRKECLKFNFNSIITVSSKDKWEDSISFFNTASKFTDTSFIIIATYASFVKSKFQSYFKTLPKETILIADEAHNLGANNISKLLTKISLNKRIGLSATINRKYDDVGNKEIEIFFNDKPPYIYSFSMEKALELGWLCQYKYYPHIVYLNESELDEYLIITKKLLKFLTPDAKSFKADPVVEMLLLERKRIIHKAHNKKNKFKNILENEFKNKKTLKYTLVYVPEGIETNYSITDQMLEDEQGFRLIDDYTKIVSSIDYSIMTKQYTSKTDNRNEILKNFELGNIHVLTSMKCLDEGVDVPRSELAIFCASTGNPRQFVQRRGRVLRYHHSKDFAIIHDLVVVPMLNGNDENYKMERNLIKSELERVVDFSNLSMNKMDTYNELKDVLNYYNLNLNDLQ